jgi:hypothetical protein
VNVRRSLAPVALLAILVAACSGGATPAPSSGPPLNHAELRFTLIDTFGPLWYCDRDFYPIAVADEADLAIKRFPEVQADTERFSAILAHVGASAGDTFSAEQKLTIYRFWKELKAINLDPTDGGSYRFDYLNQPAQGQQDGRRTTGTIDEHGAIAIEQQGAAGQPPCPICLARGTQIGTPDGSVAVEAVRVGMVVWSLGADGRRVPATVTRIGSTPVPASHRVVRLVLDDGRVLLASPGHPLVDGRPLGTLRAGDRVDGATIVSATLEPYAGGLTFDLLTDSPTGGYFAGGVPLGSTIPRG